MIRPITCICMMLAAGSGLYLYQVKHRTEMLDRSIEQTLKATDAVHERTRLMSAEWALLNDPSRLADMAAKFLTLHPVAPNQFVTMADLDRHLPPVQSYPPAGTTPPAPAAEPPIAAQPAPTNQAVASVTEPAHSPALPVEKPAAEHVASPPKLALRSEPKLPEPKLPERGPERSQERHEVLTASTLPPPPPRSQLGTVAGPMATPVTNSPGANTPGANTMMLNPVLSRVMATNQRPHATRSEDYATASPPPAVNRVTHYNTYTKTTEAPRMGSALGSTHSLLAPPVPVDGATQSALLESQ